ncbi:MAG: CBS domain-containing protein [Thaumarchaeota archaeon]|nr:CBS domain-containing protein [Nitrososphaerota archaeon]
MEGEGHLVSDIMKKKIISIDESETIKKAASMMNEAEIGSIIITKDNIPVGILTERDFVTKIASKDISLSVPVSQVMTHPLLVIAPNQTVWEVAEIMRNMGIHRVAVQEGGKIIGMVTTTDLVKIVSIGSDSNLHKIADLIFSRQEKQ